VTVRCGFNAGSHGLEQASGRQEVEVSDSDLVEIAKRNGDFKKNYGAAGGALLMAWLAWLAHLASRPQPILRSGWLFALGSALFGAWKLWLS
jgi:hypothetical protein